MALACAAACAAPIEPIEPAAVDGAPIDVTPTYYRDIAPVLAHRCGACHGEDGVAPIRLDDYASASAYAQRVRDLVVARLMPPWPADASGACGEHVDARWLEQDEIDRIAAWVDAGAPAGDPSEQVPTMPVLPAAIDVAAVLDPGESYAPVPTGPDEYRCFVLDPGIDRDQYLTAFRVRAGDTALLHHVQMWALTDASADGVAAALDAADSGPGYACLNGPGASGTYIGVWAPGDDVVRYPASTGMKLLAARHLIVQFHYHPDGTPRSDRSTVELELADDVENPLRVQWARDAMLRLPPHTEGAQARASSPLFGLGETVTVWGTRLHMHELGTRGRVELDGTCLLDVAHWQADWQLLYRLAQPRVVTPETVLSVSCTYDTRGVGHEVTWGPGDGEEMCIGYAFVSDGPDDDD